MSDLSSDCKPIVIPPLISYPRFPNPTAMFAVILTLDSTCLFKKQSFLYEYINFFILFQVWHRFCYVLELYENCFDNKGDPPCFIIF